MIDSPSMPDQSHYLGMMGNTNDNNQRLSSLTELTNEDPLIEKIRFILSGKKVYMDLKNQKKIEQKFDDELMNDFGTQRVIKHFHGYLNKNITTSCHTKEEIKMICKQFHTRMCFEVAENWIAFGIKSKTDHNQIVALLGNHVRSVYNRSLNGFTLIKSLENTNVQELRNFQDQNKEGGLSNIFRRNK